MITVFTLLLVFDSSAALVADNDSSAYLTKSEFEVIKKDFAERIKKYDGNIDEKIDDAIATYLSRMDVKTETVGLPLASWNKVTCMNGTIKPKFKYPSINAAFNQVFTATDGMSAYAWHHLATVISFISYKLTDKTDSYRPTVINVAENSASYSDAIWNGILLEWDDKFDITWLGKNTSGLYAFEYDGFNRSFEMHNMLNFSWNNYYANLVDTLETNWHIGCGWKTTYNNYNSGRYNQCGKGTAQQSAITTAVETNGKMFAHVINWKKNSSWECYNDTFLKTIRNSNSDTTLNANGWFDAATKEYKASAIRWYGKYGDVRDDIYQNLDHPMLLRNADLNGETTNYKLPRLGFVANINAEDINQLSEKVSQTINNVEYSKDDLKMNQGFLLCYAKENDTVEWEPVFDNLISSEAGLIDDTTEVILMLSTEPFGDGNDTGSDTYLIKVKNFDADTETTTPKSVNRKMKLKWKMKKDSFVYAKWYPAFDDEDKKDTKAWQVDLDLENCDTYKRTPEL